MNNSLSLSTTSARIVLDRVVFRSFVSKRLAEELHLLSSNPKNTNVEFPCLVPMLLPLGTYRVLASHNRSAKYPFVRFAKGNHYINGRCWKAGNRFVIEFAVSKYAHLPKVDVIQMGQSEPWLHTATINEVKRELQPLFDIFPDYWIYSMEIACHSSLAITPRWLARLDDQKSSANFTYAEKASDRRKSKISVQRSGERSKHHKSYHWNFYHLPTRVIARNGVSYGETNFEYTIWSHLLQKKFGVKQLEDLELCKSFEIWTALATKAGFNRKVGRADKRWENLITDVKQEIKRTQLESQIP